MQRLVRGMGMGVVFLVALAASAAAQGAQVSGTVTSATTGEKLWGATVRVKGTQTQTVTNQQGRYALVAPSDAVLTTKPSRENTRAKRSRCVLSSSTMSTRAPVTDMASPGCES